MPDAPIAAEYIEQPVATLDYAQEPPRLPDPVATGLHQLLLVSSGLSGLCVASCFSILQSQGDSPAANIIHLTIYLLTLTVAFIVGAQPVMSSAAFPAPKLRRLLDLIAACGLIIIAVAPFFFSENTDPSHFQFAVIGFAFACFALTTWRHVLLYQGLAALSRSTGRKTEAAALQWLGTVKFLYEAIWLSCCAVPLLFLSLPEDFQQKVSRTTVQNVIELCAYGALFGCFGFGVIWVAMMTIHGTCAGTKRRLMASSFQ